VSDKPAPAPLGPEDRQRLNDLFQDGTQGWPAGRGLAVGRPRLQGPLVTERSGVVTTAGSLPE
jgi:hypothetical protein